MSVSGMVQSPRFFDRAQGLLQAKRKSVMPAQAGIQTHHPPGYRFPTV